MFQRDYIYLLEVGTWARDKKTVSSFPPSHPFFIPAALPYQFSIVLIWYLRVSWRINQMGLCIIREGEVEVVYMPLSKDTQWLR